MFDYFLFLSEHIFGETHSSVAKYMNFSYLCSLDALVVEW